MKYVLITMRKNGFKNLVNVSKGYSGIKTFNKYLKFLIAILIQNFISCSQNNYNEVDYNFFLNFESDKIY